MMLELVTPSYARAVELSIGPRRRSHDRMIGASRIARPDDSGLMMAGSPRDRNVRTRLGSNVASPGGSRDRRIKLGLARNRTRPETHVVPGLDNLGSRSTPGGVTPQPIRCVCVTFGPDGLFSRDSRSKTLPDGILQERQVKTKVASRRSGTIGRPEGLRRAVR